jgi:hypothetical protein
MPAETVQSVASGKPYSVTVLPAGGSPSLDLFVDDAEFSIEGGSEPLVIRGHGVRHGDVVRFHEKDHLGGKDVRVWHITQQGAGFTAATIAVF